VSAVGPIGLGCGDRPQLPRVVNLSGSNMIETRDSGV